MNALALVIGNANYSLERNRLINAVNDANDIASKLMTLGFTVNKHTDITREAFETSVRAFGENLKKYEVGLFYFSGHGLQIDGVNYLTSIDTSFADSSSAKYSSYHLDQVIEYMQNAKTSINILILDACRDNPLPNQYRSVNNTGLAPIHAPKGTIIAFSTSPGERALDYGSGRNSIYTGSLLAHLNDKNIPIEDFFKRVRTSVYTLSNEKQTSWEHTSLIGNFYFNSSELVHSIELPYREECIADEKFRSSGSDIDTIIEDLKSYDYYTQQPAMARIKGLKISEVDDSSLFLLGRNILQTAIGGAWAARDIMERPGPWLAGFSAAEKNHVLNGLLYEIYFDSKGHFRKGNFKSDYIDKIYALEGDSRFKASFKFIKEVLEPFIDDVFYLPTAPPSVLAVEVVFETYDVLDFSNEVYTGYKLTSVKHENIELLQSDPTGRNLSEYDVSYNDFVQKIKHALGVPTDRLRLSTNLPAPEDKHVRLPYHLKLSRSQIIVSQDLTSDF